MLARGGIVIHCTIPFLTAREHVRLAAASRGVRTVATRVAISLGPDDPVPPPSVAIRNRWTWLAGFEYVTPCALELWVAGPSVAALIRSGTAMLKEGVRACPGYPCFRGLYLVLEGGPCLAQSTLQSVLDPGRDCLGQVRAKTSLEVITADVRSSVRFACDVEGTELLPPIAWKPLPTAHRMVVDIRSVYNDGVVVTGTSTLPPPGSEAMACLIAHVTGNDGVSDLSPSARFFTVGAEVSGCPLVGSWTEEYLESGIKWRVFSDDDESGNRLHLPPPGSATV